MSKRRVPIAAFGLIALAQVASAQSVRWINPLEKGVAIAKGNDRPLLCYIIARSTDRNEKVEREHNKTFRDPLAVELASRFVCVKVSRSANSDLLERWKLPRITNQEIVIANPDGELLDKFSQSDIGDARIFADKLAAAFRSYRTTLYGQKLRPVLTAAGAKPKDMLAALKTIQEFTIESADADVATLLKRAELPPAVRKQGYDTLALLSSKVAVDSLFEAALAGDRLARAALGKCQPGAAKHLDPYLAGESMEKHVIAYEATTEICNIPDAKPERFWSAPNEQAKLDEVERVRKAAEQAAQRWDATFGKYR